MRNFFQHAAFITGKTTFTHESLSDTSISNQGHTQGFLAFLRLIGTVYYKKNVNTNSPESHFQSFQTEKSPLDMHSKWLEDI